MALIVSSTTDKLTRLPNRKAFFEMLPEIISSEKKFNSNFGLLIIDISRFYRINRIYGYAIGDIVLQKMTDLLNSVRRPQDHLCRIGDNRFALILEDLMNVGHAELAAQKVLRLLEIPFVTGENKIPVECTIGVVMYPQQAHTVETLVQAAEELLHQARKDGEQIGISRKTEQVHEVSEFWDVEYGLQAVIDKQELELYYQPKISLETGLPVGAEALIRWNHPKRGLISPDLFIPIAEETGHINDITNWVLNAAMRESSEWTDKWGALTISVNIPPDFILQPFLQDFVFSAIELWGSTNVTLVLEIIERSLIKNPEKCFDILKSIQDKGIKISIDDFGTGYSTLSYFKYIPVDELKIDQSFVFGILESEEDQNIVRLITDLAHSFGMSVVAEGIESREVMNKVNTFGVDIGQGYYFAKPMPDAKFKEWLLKYNAEKSWASE